jgi:hypothetical protein
MLVVTLRHAMHVPSATASAGVGAPQRQQAIVPTVWVGRCMAARIARSGGGGEPVATAASCVWKQHLA